MLSKCIIIVLLTYISITLAQNPWDQLGEQTYSTCAACHQATGQGIPSAFPPLAGHAPELYNAEGGREYLIKLVLYGLQGEIKVGDTSYNGIMTPWAAMLSDEQIASVLNYVLHQWGNDALLEDFNPITTEEVAEQRKTSLTSQEVYQQRQQLSLE